MDKSRFATDGDRGAELAYQNGALLGERAVVSNMVSIAETHGTSGATTSLFYGQWSDNDTWLLARLRHRSEPLGRHQFQAGNDTNQSDAFLRSASEKG